SYTAVLISNTAVPSWHAAYPELPFVFTGSALASGGGVGLLAAPPAQQGPARAMAAAGAVVELFFERRVEHGMGLLSEPFQHGRAGRLLRTSQILTVSGVVAAFLGRRSRFVTAAAGLALLGGSLTTRFGIYEGGVESAKDPKYTVIPQRERLAARARHNGAGQQDGGAPRPGAPQPRARSQSPA
ncbi:MAG: nitrite reductase, partial [Actinomycetota bacterium]|nr:nitrite reductase [Actinomycetota bacterium]